MRYQPLGFALAGLLFAVPAFAAPLKPGNVAPRFDAQACLAGKAFTFSLDKALKRGPVVLYFYPSAFTKGCDLEAHTFAADKAAFKALGAAVVGVSADDIARLEAFSADPSYCAGAFPVASDAAGHIAKAYGLSKMPGLPFLKDVRGDKIGHGFIPRTTYVIARGGRIAAVFAHLAPAEHVAKALEALRSMESGGR